MRSCAAFVGLILSLWPLSTRAELSVRVRVGEEVKVIPLEAYVEGVVASEVYPDWPAEALKAQAVIARTYALHRRSEREGEAWDLDSTVLSQRYGAAPPSPRIRGAAAATRGEYLAFDGLPILAAFHSSSGGRTASSEEVWGDSLPYLRSVPSPDDEAPDYFWAYQIPLADLVRLLRAAGLRDAGEDLAVEARSASGRVVRLRTGSARISGRQLRSILGGRAIRSALFDVRTRDGVAHFLGSGAGHGVGLCQWGARELARRKQSYRQILAHYYPGTFLRRLDAASGASASWSASE